MRIIIPNTSNTNERTAKRSSFYKHAFWVFSILSLMGAVLGSFLTGFHVPIVNELLGTNFNETEELARALSSIFIEKFKSLKLGFTYIDILKWALYFTFYIIVSLALVFWVYKPFIKPMFKERELARRTGLRGVVPQKPVKVDMNIDEFEIKLEKYKEILKEQWDECFKEICSASTQQIRILCCNGYTILGDKESLLFQYFDQNCPNTSKEIEIALMHPMNKYIGDRAEQAGITIKEFRRRIKETIKSAKVLKKKKINIEVRLYFSEPTLKMLSSHDMLWLQRYNMGPIEESGVYSFFGDTKPSNSFYSFFKPVFKRVWDRGVKVDLKLTKTQITKTYFQFESFKADDGLCEICERCPKDFHDLTDLIDNDNDDTERPTNQVNSSINEPVLPTNEEPTADKVKEHPKKKESWLTWKRHS